MHHRIRGRQAAATGIGGGRRRVDPPPTGGTDSVGRPSGCGHRVPWGRGRPTRRRPRGRGRSPNGASRAGSSSAGCGTDAAPRSATSARAVPPRGSLPGGGVEEGETCEAAAVSGRRRAWRCGGPARCSPWTGWGRTGAGRSRSSWHARSGGAFGDTADPTGRIREVIWRNRAPSTGTGPSRVPAGPAPGSASSRRPSRRDATVARRLMSARHGGPRPSRAAGPGPPPRAGARSPARPASGRWMP